MLPSPPGSSPATPPTRIRRCQAYSQRTTTASIWTIGGKLLARLLDFVSLLVLARVLKPEDFGLVAIATSVLVVVEAVLDLPLTQALIRQPSLTDKMLDTAFTLSVLRGAAISLTMFVLAWPMAFFYDDPRLILLVAALSVAPSHAQPRQSSHGYFHATL